MKLRLLVCLLGVAVSATACSSNSEQFALPEVAGILDQSEEFTSLDELASRSIVIAVVRPADGIRYVDLAGSPTPITTVDVIQVIAGSVPGDTLEIVQGYASIGPNGSEVPLISANTEFLVFLERFVLGVDNGDDSSPRTEYNSVGGPAGIFMKLNAQSNQFARVDQNSPGLPLNIGIDDVRGIAVAQEHRAEPGG